MRSPFNPIRDDQGDTARPVFLMDVMVYVDKAAKTKQFLRLSKKQILLSCYFNFSARLKVRGRIQINSSSLGHSPGNGVKISLFFPGPGCRIPDGEAMHVMRKSVSALPDEFVPLIPNSKMSFFSHRHKAEKFQLRACFPQCS